MAKISEPRKVSVPFTILVIFLYVSRVLIYYIHMFSLWRSSLFFFFFTNIPVSNFALVLKVRLRLHLFQFVDGEEPETRQMIWQGVVDELAAESVKRGCGDNVSVIIVVLNDLE